MICYYGGYVINISCNLFLLEVYILLILIFMENFKEIKLERQPGARFHRIFWTMVKTLDFLLCIESFGGIM